MKLIVDPPLRHWAPRRDRAVGVIATGHQPWLWHPGILAKYIAAAVAARTEQRTAAHIVVDTDLIAGLGLEVPIARRGGLDSHRLELASVLRTVPTVLQPPVDGAAVVRALRAAPQTVATTRQGSELLADLTPLVQAWTDLPPAGNLARQITQVLTRLMHPYVGAIEPLYASELLQSSCGEELVAAMLSDADACARAYNRAAAQYPQARIRPLHVGVDVVELPLWSMRESTRQPVYVQRVDRGPAVLDAGVTSLAPRALLLTAVMRTCRCDLFIHGKGGGIYDQVTEAWWKDWRHESLAPMAVVSADLTLDFDVPQTTADELARARWYAHHLPSNLDRALPLNDPRATDKRQLIAHMNDDRNAARRAAAFAEIHAINQHWARGHAQPLTEARQRVADMQQACANAVVAAKRDWCFALYPPDKLQQLARAIQNG